MISKQVKRGNISDVQRISEELSLSTVGSLEESNYVVGQPHT